MLYNAGVRAVRRVEGESCCTYARKSYSQGMTLPRFARPVFFPGVLAVWGISATLTGCASFTERRTQDRTNAILWRELVPAHEIRRSCEEVADVVADFFVTQGLAIDFQSPTRIRTKRTYFNASAELAPVNERQSISAIAALRASTEGASPECRIEITTIEIFGTRPPHSGRAPNWELLVIEKLDPLEAGRLRAEARKRAEAAEK